ncbi:DNA methyltransferase [Fibrobacter sp.]|uniref:DNA methyltransferase n=1 Tax=Fibrobacter sp. TaxID=35828 RepID=UPI00388E7FCD
MKATEQQTAAKKFVKEWSGKGYEKGECQKFWIDLLCNVFGIQDFADFIFFEEQVKEKIVFTKKSQKSQTITNFIDAYIPSTRVMIEQKSSNKDLRERTRQSDGKFLTPYEQAKRYVAELPLSQHPKWIVACNFSEFLVYNMENPSNEPEQIFLKDLPKEYHRLNFLVDARSEHIQREVEISVKAGEIVGKIYDALLPEFGDNPTTEDLHALNVLCVRIVFCLYAEDAGIFQKEQFYNYLKSFRVENMRVALRELFRVLDTKLEDRDRFMEEKLAEFPYVNGSLFHEKEGETIPPISEMAAEIILTHGSLDFDWSDISPTIFGAVFESTLNPETRRSGGMHYTSIENIHKVIDPLFLNDLNAEFLSICEIKTVKTRNDKLENFQKKLGSLKFLDPACGSGNFLTETYASLRKLENKCIRLRLGSKPAFDVYGDEFKLQVNIDQFYGIEINDFAVNVAKAALWIAENQMMKETAQILGRNLEFLPLKTNATIVEGNALRMDWEYLSEIDSEPSISADKVNIVSPKELNSNRALILAEPRKHYKTLTVITDDLHIGKAESARSKNHYDYVMGNPPFIGARLMNGEQKSELQTIFKGVKNNGNLDYVSCWYKKTADLIKGTNTKVALVSTNSISQGEQPAILWESLWANGMQIDFAYRTFRWDSESEQVAHVHCVIIGFSSKNSLAPTGIQSINPKKIFLADGKDIKAQNINPYLMDAPNILVKSRQVPLCEVPEIGIGNKPIDGGNYLFTEEEKLDFIKKEPESEKYFKKWLGSEEFINRYYRWCLWMGDCSPTEIRQMKECYKRVQAVKDFRLASKSAPTRKLAEKPTRFHVENFPAGNYILIPEVSSEKRRYIPMGFMTPDIFCSNLVKIIPDATLYHFGILTSNIHMAWVRAVCGRLKSDYRYSKDIVYNNFPWSNPSDAQKARIEATAQAILDIRAKYPDSSLADLYDELTMPADLRKAHTENDHSVMEAYGFSPKMTEDEIVAELFKMYEKLTK